MTHSAFHTDPIYLREPAKVNVSTATPESDYLKRAPCRDLIEFCHPGYKVNNDRLFTIAGFDHKDCGIHYNTASTLR